jgi:ribosomal protein S26
VVNLCEWVQLRVWVPGARLCEPQHVRTVTCFDCSEILARAKLLRVTDPRSPHDTDPVRIADWQPEL